MDEIPDELQPLAEEARKYDSAEEFVKAFTRQIKHGRYWHVTKNPNFKINPELGPRDMSSMAKGEMEKGKLMITSDLEYWVCEYQTGAEEYGAIPREYVAEIDMSAVPPSAYKQVNRGFGNEFYVSDPSKAKVIRVIPVEQALKESERYDDLLDETIHNKDKLTDFYNQATSINNEKRWQGMQDNIWNNDIDIMQSMIGDGRHITDKYLAGVWGDIGEHEKISKEFAEMTGDPKQVSECNDGWGEIKDAFHKKLNALGRNFFTRWDAGKILGYMASSGVEYPADAVGDIKDNGFSTEKIDLLVDCGRDSLDRCATNTRKIIRCKEDGISGNVLRMSCEVNNRIVPVDFILADREHRIVKAIQLSGKPDKEEEPPYTIEEAHPEIEEELYTPAWDEGYFDKMRRKEDYE